MTLVCLAASTVQLDDPTLLWIWMPIELILEYPYEKGFTVRGLDSPLFA